MHGYGTLTKPEQRLYYIHKKAIKKEIKETPKEKEITKDDKDEEPAKVKETKEKVEYKYIPKYWKYDIVYYGQFECGLYHGEGQLSTMNGIVYKGQFEKGYKHGVGWEFDG